MPKRIKTASMILLTNLRSLSKITSFKLFTPFQYKKYLPAKTPAPRPWQFLQLAMPTRPAPWQSSQMSKLDINKYLVFGIKYLVSYINVGK